MALTIIYIYIIDPDETRANATLEPCMYLFSLMYFSGWCYIMVFQGERDKAYRHRSCT
jgi:hypothetical protein